jgi:hypothetical protein
MDDNQVALFRRDLDSERRQYLGLTPEEQQNAAGLLYAPKNRLEAGLNLFGRFLGSGGPFAGEASTAETAPQILMLATRDAAVMTAIDAGVSSGVQRLGGSPDDAQLAGSIAAGAYGVASGMRSVRRPSVSSSARRSKPMSGADTQGGGDAQPYNDFSSPVPENLRDPDQSSDGPKGTEPSSPKIKGQPRETPNDADMPDGSPGTGKSQSYNNFSDPVSITSTRGGSADSDNVEYEPGTFSISDWEGYPYERRPSQPVRLREGAELKAATKAKKNANYKLRQKLRIVGDKTVEVHEITPIKFGGHPTDIDNKVVIPAQKHAEISKWFNSLQRDIEGRGYHDR